MPQKSQNKLKPITISINFNQEMLMLSKRLESTGVDRRTWLHAPSGTLWSTSSDINQVVEILKESSSTMYTPL